MISRSLSPLRYPGGKAILAPILERLIYANDLQGGVYIEAFAGGAGAGLRLLADGHVDRIVINDADRAVYSFWKAVMNDTDELVDRIKSINLSMDEWYVQRDIYLQPKGKSRIDLGFATFFLNRCNRSGIIKGGGPIGGIKQSGKWKLDARFNREGLANRIKEIASYGDRIVVLKEDAKRLLSSVSSRFSDARAFVYADPPYYVKGAELYLSHYSESDHEELARTLLEQPTVSWVMTYDDVKQIRALYGEQQLIDFSLRYSAHHSSTVGGELFIAPPRMKLPESTVKLLRGLRKESSTSAC